MTVRELRELLMKYPDTARVYEERQAELRELREEDVKFDESGEGNPFSEEDEATTGPILVFGAWS